VEVLSQLIKQTRNSADDEHTAISLNRRFHEVLAARCGSRTLQALIGSLDLLWSGQEQGWEKSLASRYTMENRLAGIAAHERVLDKIRQGDGVGAYPAMSGLIAEGYTYAIPELQELAVTVRQPPG
jgi:DNA-binding GntR family transcriptional regulator